MDDGVDDPERQSVLLVDQDAQEDAVHSAVVHLGDLEHGG